MAPKRGRPTRGKVGMDTRATPPSTHGPGAFLSNRGGGIRWPHRGHPVWEVPDAPMARRRVVGEGQHVLWRLAHAQPNSGSSAMGTRGATPDCSGEGAITSYYDTLYVGIHGVHRAV